MHATACRVQLAVRPVTGRAWLAFAIGIADAFQRLGSPFPLEIVQMASGRAKAGDGEDHLSLLSSRVVGAQKNSAEAPRVGGISTSVEACLSQARPSRRIAVARGRADETRTERTDDLDEL